MSIIYDALKKVEVKFEEPRRQKPQTRVYLIYFAIIAALFLGAGFLYKIFMPRGAQNHQRLTQQQTQEPAKPSLLASQTQAEEPAPMPKKPSLSALVLNGIFYSKNESYALINNQIVKEGDLIEGRLIKKIDTGGIELGDEDTITKLTIKTK